jgi:2-octaprenyl-6-methoxyphenol hydroxylase
VNATEILIIGGGPVGCALALALRQAGRAVTVLERQPRHANGAKGVDDANNANHAADAAALSVRPIALSHASRLILERLDVWQTIPVTAIEQVHVSQQGAPGRTLLDATDADVPALGYVADYAALGGALAAHARAANIPWLDGADAQHVEPTADDVTVHFVRGGLDERVHARCVVHAEGTRSTHGTDGTDGTDGTMRVKTYGQEGIVALIETRPAAGHRAFERFTPQGPLALLPAAGRYAAVWSMGAARARSLAAAPDQAFLDALAETIGGRLGTLRSAGPRSIQPLALRVRPSRIGVRQVYIGNAAQTLHPVAGQGLNLGLRDAWDLAEHWVRAADPGAAGSLTEFATLRQFDARVTVGVTEMLLRAFGGTHPLLRAGRGIALTALDLHPPLRRFFARRMIFGPSAIP